MRKRNVLIVGLVIYLVTSGALCADAVLAIDSHIIASGTSVRSTSTCFRLQATIAEPVAGFSSSTDFALSAGFRSVAAPNNDDIFFSGFEDCTP